MGPERGGRGVGTGRRGLGPGENPSGRRGPQLQGGRIRRQEPGGERSRVRPTVGEAEPREKARKEREELERQAAEAAAWDEQRRRTPPQGG